ncbi:hypothetical protein AOLI_G00080170 [Acnodon oligacanthus]
MMVLMLGWTLLSLSLRALLITLLLGTGTASGAGQRQRIHLGGSCSRDIESNVPLRQKELSPFQHEPVCISTRRFSPLCGCQNRSGAGSVSLGRNKRLPESVTFNRLRSAGATPEDPAPNGSPGFCSVCVEPGAQHVLWLTNIMGTPVNSPQST